MMNVLLAHYTWPIFILINYDCVYLSLNVVLPHHCYIKKTT